MALQTLKGYAYFPPPISNGEFGFNFITLDAAGEKSEAVFPVPHDGSITHVSFRTGTVTTAQTLRVSLQTLDAAGNASGTYYGGSTQGTQAAPAANTWYRVALGTAATGVEGNRVAQVVEWDGTAGSLNIASYLSPAAFAPQNTYIGEFTTGAWVKTRTRMAACAVDYAGTYYPHFTFPATTVGAEAWNDTNNPDERGNRFSLPFKARAVGVWFQGQILAGGTGTISLYGATTETAALDIATLASASDYHTNYVMFDNPVSLEANTVYRMTLKSTHASNFVGVMVTTVASNALLDAHEGGLNMYYTTQNNGGGFTDTTTKCCVMGLILDQLSDDVGGAGGIKTHPGMTGGIRG